MATGERAALHLQVLTQSGGCTHLAGPEAWLGHVRRGLPALYLKQPQPQKWGAILGLTGPCALGQRRSAEGLEDTLGAQVQLPSLGGPRWRVEANQPWPEFHDPQWGNVGAFTNGGPGVNGNRCPGWPLL